MHASSAIIAGASTGDFVAGKYRVERVIGEGGMGRVVAARHVELDELVAIKVLLPAALQKPEAVARFAREARAAVKVKSEHVARTFDVGALESGAPYIVMEYLEGIDLCTMLMEQRALPIEEAVEFILQAGEAIAEAHANGIVHRDLKPANLFCVRRVDGVLSIKVLDFGISKVTGAHVSSISKSITTSATVFGSPCYMSPEQLHSSHDVDARADIWALGVILFELISGRVPFEGETLLELCLKVAGERTPRIRSICPDVPPELELAICKCLEKERNARFSNIAELALALAPFAPKRSRASVERISGIIRCAGVSVPPPASARTPDEPKTVVETLADWTSTHVPRIRRRSAIVLLGAMVVVLGTGIWVWSPKDAESAEYVAEPTATVVAPTPTPLPRSTPLVFPVAATASTTQPSGESAPPSVALPSERLLAGPRQAKRTLVKTTLRAPFRTGRPAAASPASSTSVKSASSIADAFKPNCDPPYRLDEQGRKHFKAACYVNQSR